MRANRAVAVVGVALSSIAWSITLTDAATKSPLSMRVDLNVTTAAPGKSIHGTAIITNASSKVIVVQTVECTHWLYVGLANKSTPYHPAILVSSCVSSIDLLPGTTRLPVTVSTKYQSCGGTPRCLKSGLPPLPKGEYHVSVITIGGPSISYRANRVMVTLT